MTERKLEDEDSQLSYRIDLQLPIAYDLMQVSQSAERGFEIIEHVWIFDSYEFVSEAGISVRVQPLKNDTTFSFICLDRYPNFSVQSVMFPKGVLIGIIHFTPHQKNNLQKKHINNIRLLNDHLLQGAQGLSEFFIYMDREKAKGGIIPAILLGVTNKRMAAFAQKYLGFYKGHAPQSSGRKGATLLIGATYTVREKFEELKAEPFHKTPLIEYLEQRDNKQKSQE